MILKLDRVPPPQNETEQNAGRTVSVINIDVEFQTKDQ